MFLCKINNPNVCIKTLVVKREALDTAHHGADFEYSINHKTCKFRPVSFRQREAKAFFYLPPKAKLQEKYFSASVQAFKMPGCHFFKHGLS